MKITIAALIIFAGLGFTIAFAQTTKSCHTYCTPQGSCITTCF